MVGASVTGASLLHWYLWTGMGYGAGDALQQLAGTCQVCAWHTAVH